IDIRFNTLLKTADSMMLYKYIVKNTARKHGKTVTFMPKPIFGDNGSGMHVHQSLWKGEKPLFYDGEGYSGLSQLARYYIGGLLTHAPALLGIVASTTNSYKRLVPGSLDAALDALEDDHSLLLEGGVFTTDVLEHFVELKRAQSDEVRLRPTPLEFALYYDA